MNAALSQLLFLRLRGGFRHRMTQLATLRGAAFLAIVAGIVWLLLGPGAVSPGDNVGGFIVPDTEQLRAQIRDYLPVSLLGAGLFTVAMTSGPAIYFSPNEINYLFTGPFSRRDLVIYKFATYFAGAIFSAAIICLLIPSRSSTVAAAFIGTLFTLVFIQLFSAALKIAAQTLDETRFAWIKKPVLLTVAGAAAATLVYIVLSPSLGLDDVVAAFRQSWPGRIVLAPFSVLAELFLARDMFPGLAVWTAVALAINGALLAIIVALDQCTSDRSLSANRQLSERWLRIRRGGSFWASDKTTGNSVRRAPHLAGIGPIAWRQSINAVRNTGRVILVFLAIAALTGPLLLNAGLDISSSGMLGIAYFFIAFIMPRSLVCDFRGELSRMEHYKSLPTAPWRICVGQLAVPVVLASAIQLVMIASVLPFVDLTTGVIVTMAALFVVPFNLLLYGLENFVFLLFPTKLVPVGRVDFDFLGRTLVDFIAKSVIIFTTLSVARNIGIKMQLMTGSLTVFALTSLAIVTVAALATIPLSAWSFRRFKLRETME